MKNLFVYCFLCICSLSLSSQVKSKLAGKLKCKVFIKTEFTTFEEANKQVAENYEKYKWLHESVFNFKKNDVFEVKLKNGQIEKGRYTADDTRVILLFDNQEIEEFNTSTPTIDNNNILLPFGRGMTKVIFELGK